MRTFSLEALRAVLDRQVPIATPAICVAYSGGLDSTVLLHALAQLRETDPFALRAIHIDHQLQSASGQWSEHCRRIAERLNVPLLVRAVIVNVGAEGLEAAARRARYGALLAELEANELLFTAHHADDQLETVLLALMRGAGLRGLSGMPAIRTFGAGWIVRPMLEFARSDLERWAREHDLSWIEDPTNASVSMDRNYVRQHVLPNLSARWPSGSASAVRSAAHAAESASLLDQLASIDWQKAAVGECIDVRQLSTLDSARRRNLLRYWLRSFGIRAPSKRKLAGLERDVLAASGDRVPRVTLEGVAVYRHRDLLYVSPTLPDLPLDLTIAWDVRRPLELPAKLGTLHLHAAHGRGLSQAKLPRNLQVSFRQGGETIRVAGDRHHRELKKVLQDAFVLPWWRSRLPLIYAGEELAAVGDLWVSEEFCASSDEPSMTIEWSARPSIKAVR